jgi:DNA-binding NtrC family response regulator
MTTVLIVDPNEETRLALESQLAESNQFERVLSCSGLKSAQAMLKHHEVKVMLIDADQLGKSSTLHEIKASHPEIGVVLVRGNSGVLDSVTLQELGAHAQTSRLAAPMEIVASVAKALVVRLRPGKGLLGKLWKDGK